MSAPADTVDLAHRRMHNLRLSGPPLASVEDAVRWLGAVQSQDYGPAKWSIGLRVPGICDADIDKAFADAAILRTHVLRPTWHFVLPADIRWLLALTAPRVHALNAYYYRQLGLDPDIRRKCHALLAGVLTGGGQLTRKEIAAALAGTGVTGGAWTSGRRTEPEIATDGFRLTYILMSAELDGVLCSGALRGKQHTYALLDERAPDAPGLARDDALAELTRRYFTSHGPATAKDFRWWSSLTAADVRDGLDAVGAHLTHEVVGGVSYWSAGSTPPPAVESPTVHLLQAYDEYIVGSSESRYVLDVSGAARINTRDRAVYNGVVILDSQVVGAWKRTVERGRVTITAALYASLDKAQTEALHDAADRHGRFLGLPASVEVTVA
jgi:hypothetical protein